MSCEASWRGPEPFGFLGNSSCKVQPGPSRSGHFPRGSWGLEPIQEPPSLPRAAVPSHRLSQAWPATTWLGHLWLLSSVCRLFLIDPGFCSDLQLGPRGGSWDRPNLPEAETLGRPLPYVLSAGRLKSKLGEMLLFSCWPDRGSGYPGQFLLAHTGAVANGCLWSVSQHVLSSFTP